jgi:hypothetical protein
MLFSEELLLLMIPYLDLYTLLQLNAACRTTYQLVTKKDLARAWQRWSEAHPGHSKYTHTHHQQTGTTIRLPLLEVDETDLAEGATIDIWTSSATHNFHLLYNLGSDAGRLEMLANGEHEKVIVGWKKKVDNRKAYGYIFETAKVFSQEWETPYWDLVEVNPLRKGWVKGHRFIFPRITTARPDINVLLQIFIGRLMRIEGTRYIHRT